MDNIAVIVTLILSATFSCTYGHLRLKKVCETGDPTGTIHTLVHAFSYTDCARACDVNTYCNYVSFHEEVCAMYNDVSVCTAVGGPTRDVYEVDPPCEPGWHRYGGSCYLVDLNGKNGVMGLWGCTPHYIQHDADPVSINNAAEGIFLAQLLLSMDASYTSVWLGGTYNYGPFNAWYGSNEPLVYQNWEDGEPNNLSSEVCVAMDLTNGKWTTENCGISKIAVCEMPL